MIFSIVGDLQLRDKLYADNLVEGGREDEKQEVLNAIIENSKDADAVVFLGDNFDRKQNTSKTIETFTSLIENFQDKKVYIIAGNHEKYANGSTAIDYLSEIKNKNWVIATNTVVSDEINGQRVVLCPFFFKEELGETDAQKSSKLLMEKVEKEKGGIIFHHHAITGSSTDTDQMVNMFDEPIFDLDFIEKNFDMSFSGHIHKPHSLSEKVHIVGSVFTEKVGEEEKFLYKYDTDSGKVETILLPNRPITKKYATTVDEVIASKDLGKIVKVVMREKPSIEDMERLKKHLEETCDGYNISVMPQKTQRANEDLKIDKPIQDYTVKDMLELYSKVSNVDMGLLTRGMEIIREYE